MPHAVLIGLMLIALMLWGSAYLAWLAWRLWPRTPKLSDAARRVLARHGPEWEGSTEDADG